MLSFYWIIACICIVWFWMRQIMVDCLWLHTMLLGVTTNQLYMTSAQPKRLHANKIVICCFTFFYFLTITTMMLRRRVVQSMVWGGLEIFPLKIWWRCAFYKMHNKHILLTNVGINYYHLASSCVHSLHLICFFFCSVILICFLLCICHCMKVEEKLNSA